MPFGPSRTEAVFLFELPLLLSLALGVCLLFSWPKFLALVGALVGLALYVAVGVALLSKLVGAMMLLFSEWSAVVLLAMALYLSTRK